ncbi:MAG TPA: nucleoside hydrolase [Gemmatimonadales bacterium]
MGRRSSRLLLGALLLVLVLLLSFALPVRVWRTGELPAPPLPLVRGGPQVYLPERVWIDTDAACGSGRTVDPDDCLALLLLLRSPGLTVVGISTVHGNAPLELTDSVTRALLNLVSSDSTPPVYRGSPVPVGEAAGRPDAPAYVALRRALDAGPLTVVALGPLTNIALALAGAPGSERNVGRLVAVMGRRPGHLFHPAEGAAGGMLFGHGPVFTDFNFAQDREAATRVLALGLPMSLVPYEAARQVTLSPRDLGAIERASAPGAWVVERSREWLDYWKEEIGREGFYPFDLVAAAYVVEPGLFDCAPAEAWVAEDERLWGWLDMPDALMVGLGPDPEDEVRAKGRVVYCSEPRAETHRRLLEALTSAGPRRDGRGAREPSS